MTRDMALSAERLDAALYSAQGAATDLIQDGLDPSLAARLTEALDAVARVSQIAQGRRVDPGPVTERSVIESLKITNAEQQVVIHALARELVDNERQRERSAAK